MQKIDENKDPFFGLYTKAYDNEIIIAIINKAKTVCCNRTWDRIAKILNDILSQNLDGIKKECYAGLPDDLACLRSLIWSLNFHYITYDSKNWRSHLFNKREEYNQIKEAFILRQDAELKIFEEVKNKTSDENCPETEKQEILELANRTDKELLELIDKDVNRTHTNFDFFSRPVNEETTLSDDELQKMYFRKRNCVYSDPMQLYTKGHQNLSDYKNSETHSDVIGRILYIFSKLNRDIGYVQGMNEILAPIYYCLASDLSFSQDFTNVEADAFWCFTHLMSSIKSTFIQKNDGNGSGIFHKAAIMDKLIEKMFKKVSLHLKKFNLSIAHFAFKWFNLFFSQDLIIPDILRLWDTFFVENDKFYFVYYFGLAIIKVHEEKILSLDYYGTLKFFQDLNEDELETFIETGLKIKKSSEKKVKAIIYEKEEHENESIKK